MLIDDLQLFMNVVEQLQQKLMSIFLGLPTEHTVLHPEVLLEFMRRNTLFVAFRP